MTTANKVIAWIEANYLGKGEPFPPKYGEWIPFQESWGYPASLMVEWCGGLLCEGTRQTGGTIGSRPTDTAPNSWWTVAGVQGFMQRGDWIPADGKVAPQRGDWIYFDWRGGGYINSGDFAGANKVDHVGIITDTSRWNAENGWVIETIEGNVGERCGRFLRYDNELVVGFGRPRYGIDRPVDMALSAEVQGAFNSLSPSQKATFGKQWSGEVTKGDGWKIAYWERGAVAVHPTKGVRVVEGAIYAKWFELAWAGDDLGAPISSEEAGPVPGSRMNSFDGGTIFWSAATGPHVVKGAILWKYIGERLAQTLGLPISDQIDGAVPGTKISIFENGAIVWSPESGAYVVSQGFLHFYLHSGKAESIGHPLGNESQISGGSVQRFSKADLYWNADPGSVTFVPGSLRDAYVSNGGYEVLGLPTTDPLPAFTQETAEYVITASSLGNRVTKK